MPKQESTEDRKKRAVKIVRQLHKLYPDADCALKHGSAMELLVATILSAQSTDETVNKVTPVLFSRYPTAAALASADPAEIEKLIQILHAEVSPAPEPSKTFTAVSIDSRSIKPGQCFFAIPGENFDGRDFIPQAIKNGAACIVSQKLDEKAPAISPDVPLLIVDDAVAALGKFAA